MVPQIPVRMKLFTAIKAGVSAFRNYFDGASDNPQRSSTVYFPLDSTKEINPHHRREMVKKHRSLRNNLGFVRGIVNTTVRLSIGWGLQPIPKSPDRAFNQRASAYWKRYTRRQSFDAAHQDNEAAMQRLVLREVLTDGEIFAIKVVDDFGRPQRQLLKTEVIGDPPDKGKDSKWLDGILTNSLNRPLEYCVLKQLNPLNPGLRKFERVAARDVLHVYDRERATQMRGLPWGYTGLNHGVDCLDIAAFEKIAHKLNTAIVGSLSTQTGEVPASMNGLLSTAQEAATAGSTRNTREAAKYLDLHGTMVPVFKTGDSMSLFLQGRNSMNTTEFAGWLCAQYAHGFGLPVETIVGMLSGGAAVRGNLELTGRFCEEVQMLMIDDWCQPNYENVIGTALLAAQYPKDFPMVEPLEPPQDFTGWDVCEWRGPKNITVDRGRDGKLYLEQKRAGLLTHEEWWTMNGEDPTEMDERIDDETQERLKRWLARGLPEEKFWIRELGQPGATAASASPDQNDPPAPPIPG